MRDRRPARSTEPWTWAGPSLLARSPRPTENSSSADAAVAAHRIGIASFVLLKEAAPPQPSTRQPALCRYRRRIHRGFTRFGQAPVVPGVAPHGLARRGFAEISSGKAKTSLGRPSARSAGSFRSEESTMGKYEASDLGDLPQRHGIHTITQTPRGRAIREDVAQVRVTSVADSFDALQKRRPVKPVGNDILLDGLCEGWPAGIRLKFLRCIE